MATGQLLQSTGGILVYLTVEGRSDGVGVNSRPCPKHLNPNPSRKNPTLNRSHHRIRTKSWQRPLPATSGPSGCLQSSVRCARPLPGRRTTPSTPFSATRPTVYSSSYRCRATTANTRSSSTAPPLGYSTTTEHRNLRLLSPHPPQTPRAPNLERRRIGGHCSSSARTICRSGCARFAACETCKTPASSSKNGGAVGGQDV